MERIGCSKALVGSSENRALQKPCTVPFKRDMSHELNQEQSFQRGLTLR